MKTFNKIFHFFLTFAFILLSGQLAAQNSQEASSVDRVGTTSAQFLKITAGARAVGMGSAYSAVSDDILAIYWNPAGLSRINGNGEVIFNHAEWIADTDYDFAAFSLNLGGVGSLGFSLISFRTPEQPVRTVSNPEGTGQNWNANSISLGATFSKRLTADFSIGFTGKFVQEKIFNVSATGASFDLGVLYDTPLKNLTLGASISNFGTKMRLDGRDLFFNESPLANDQGAVDEVPAKYRTDAFEMPLNLRFGLAYKAVQNEQVEVLLSADGSQPNDNSESLNGGIEIGIKNIVFLRGGYKNWLRENSEEGFTFGAGLRYDAVGTNFKFDFGWADFGRLQNVKFVSFAIRY